MTGRMQDLIDEILRLQSELEAEIDQRREALGWRLRERFVEFEEGISAEHRRLKTSAARFLAESSLTSIFTAPVIYSLILPLVMIDLWANLYQQICFRAYGIPRVRRADYVVFDRARLGYLNWIEALNCRYCSYANGVVAFVREIASRTEQYWCPIKHALKANDPHRRYVGFLDYGDADGYRTRLEELRTLLREETAHAEAETTAPKA
jgi:hypothetical protein